MPNFYFLIFFILIIFIIHYHLIIHRVIVILKYHLLIFINQKDLTNNQLNFHLNPLKFISLYFILDMNFLDLMFKFIKHLVIKKAVFFFLIFLYPNINCENLLL